jgi:PAS domain S-box-containing protein
MDAGRLRAVLDGLFTYVGLFSLEGVILDVNQAPLAASGLTRERVVGHKFFDLPWWSHSATERARIVEAIARGARGETSRFETTVRRMAGGIRHVDAAFVPLRDDGGAVTQVIGTGVDITARKTAEEALARSEQRLAEAQRVAHVGSWEWSVASNRVTWSDELHRIYGLEEGRFEGTYQAFLARVYPDDRQHTETVVRQALQNATAVVYDHRIVRPDGSVRMLHTRAEVVVDPDGTPLRMMGSCWDVTERWQATRRLERSVSLLRSTLEATADGILVVDRAGAISAFNRRFLELWGLPPDTAEGAADQPLVVAVSDQLEDPQGFVAKVAELYGQPEAESLDVLRFKDGRVFERYSRPQRIGAEVVGRVWSFRDVTDRERLLRGAERDRAGAEKARGELENILERVSDGFVALDRDWRYAYVNQCGGRMLGREPASLVGKHVWTLFPEGAGQPFQRAYERAVAEQKPVQIRERYEPWDRWFESRVYPSSDGLSIFFSDVTEQQRTEEQLRSSHEQLRALAARLDAVREEERRVMAREIHDQIGQALTALKLDLAWLSAHLALATDEDTRQHAGRMNQVLDETLETARRVSAELRPVLLDDLGLPAAIEWQLRDFESRTGVRCTLDLEPAGAGGLTPAEALVLFRILQEALTNVARHAAAHRVRVGLAAGARETVLSIADDGRGIAPEELSRPTALGLVGMRERALVLGGAVTVGPAPGGGTAVTARIPRASAPP